MKRYDLHEEAVADLKEIGAYISIDNVDAAKRIADEIFDAILMLSSFPHAGHQRPDLTSRPLRFQVVREYLIAYAPDENPLWVIAILHGRRSPHLIASILRARK